MSEKIRENADLNDNSDGSYTQSKRIAAGSEAVSNSLRHIVKQSGVVKGTKALLNVNQKDGFDCPGCAWPDPDNGRSFTEFCENGAKAVAAEATTKRVDPSFFDSYSITELLEKSDFWLEQQGRITHPMYLKKGSDNYESISWDDAFKIVENHLNNLNSPDDAIMYTSGRASNEAAFLYQLFARVYGTNNLPDCSNMCHESSGVALDSTLGIGKGTVKLEDFEKTQAVFILGQNPGTNHPRMLSALQECKRNGGRIVSVNPLKEAGLIAFAHPQEVAGFFGKPTELTDVYLQININGDQAFLKGLAKIIFENPHRIDNDFVQKYTQGFSAYEQSIGEISWESITQLSGLSEKEIRDSARILIESETAIFCWAMGLTQHKNAVSTIQEIVNVQLLLGNIGKAYSGLCPVRGHSNVQGDRTMGICEKMPDSFFDKMDEKYGLKFSRNHGYDTIAAIEAMSLQKGMVFLGLGGNFVMASPDTNFTSSAIKNCSLTVQISTKLNRSHLVTGEQALIFPCLGRSEKDEKVAGKQFVTVENSMGVVHSSTGSLKPASEFLRSEPSIIAELGKVVLGKRGDIPWEQMRDDYNVIRDHISDIIPGFENFNERVKNNQDFYLPNSARDLDFSKIGGKAQITCTNLDVKKLDQKKLLLMTIRSHDQYNTTIYGLDDRYRGIKKQRKVVFVNLDDLRQLGIESGQPVDLTSHFEGEQRHAYGFRAIPYDIPRGCAAAYFPETNVLVPISSYADLSRTPTSKGILVSIKASS